MSEESDATPAAVAAPGSDAGAEKPPATLVPAAAPPPAAALLASARAAAGLSLADAARQLKLSPAQVEALEAGDYARLPGPVFVRGFLRNYARLLEVDPAPLLAGIAAQAPVAPTLAAVPARPADIPLPRPRRLRWQPFALAGALVFAALGLYVLFEEDPATPTTPAAPAASGATAVPGSETRVVELPPPQVMAGDAPVPATEATPAAPAPVPAAPAPAVAPAVPPSAGARPTLAAAPLAAARPPAATGSVLRFTFERDAWVEVRDGAGRVVHSRLSRAGSSETVAGQPPLRVVVGNAAGVRVFLNDKPVDLAPHTQVDVARLTLE